jgi:molybdopterin/thiamine biosynthesis adenylyltransferase
MRYQQLTRFKEIGDKGRSLFEQKTVAIVGLGNIGSTLAVMLLQSGISLRLIDKGRVDVTELSSQALYLEEDHSKFKAKQAKKYLEVINPKAKVRTFHEHLTKNNAYLIDADAIVDASGSLETTEIIAAQAKKKKAPLIFAAVSGSRGIVAFTDKGLPVERIKKELSCMKPVSSAGVINPAVYMASSIVASKIMRILLKKPLAREIVHFNAWDETIKKSRI